MTYFFPSSITSIPKKQEILSELKNTVDSGTNALRILLRSFELEPNSKIAIPAFVCDAVQMAVIEENHNPFPLDLKAGHTFWTNYDLDKIAEEKIQAIILVHLYGFIHPDTAEIIAFCKKKQIKLIHDAAQSFGIQENLLSGDGIIYSFGPGKSTTAAGGAYIKNLKLASNHFIINKPSFFSFQNSSAKLFLKSRIVGYKKSKIENLTGLFISKLSLKSKSISSMSKFQLKMASYVIANFKTNEVLRKMRYDVFQERIKNNSLIELIPVNHLAGLNFKIILFIENNVKKFKSFLTENYIPYFSLSDHISKNEDLENFNQNADKIIEISCESSIAEVEIIRIANLLSTYR
ncbi:MAG: DegT/DnrJ/EryC1/StrS family aminotransferase [Bacteroidia bacterium]